MTKNFTAEQKRIEREIERLQKQKEALAQKAQKPAIASIISQMKSLNITPHDIAAAYEAATKTGKRGRKASGSSSANKKPVVPVKPKYQDPETGQTWTGRGIAPVWIREAEAAGKDRSSFLIKDSDNSAPPQEAPAVESSSNPPGLYSSQFQ